MIGKRVSHYQIEERLGGGGMGVVYRAHDAHLDRSVALKLLPASLSADEESRERFILEAKVASALDHPNICTIYDVDLSEEGELFIAMAFYEGETLKKRLSEGSISQELAINIASQIAGGIAAAHAKGIIHRDIKPANLFLTEDGRVVILDFGVAKLAGAADITRPGSTLGTAAYMSPEQTRGEKVDRRTDIWSLGVVLYEMLSGRRPFEGEYDQAVSYAIVNEPVEPLHDLPEAYQKILDKSLSKDLTGRYASAVEMHTDLQSLPANVPSRHQKPGQTGTVGRMRWIAAVVILAAVPAYFVIHALSVREAAPAPRELPAVAVLPFRPLSAEAGHHHFAEAMTEALIGNLSRIEGLLVRSRQSVMRFGSATEALPQIANQLEADYLVQGSVFWGRDRLRVDVQLVDGEADAYIWSSQYEEDANEVLRVQRDLAIAIAEEISGALTSADERRLPSSRPVVPEAYGLLLSARNLRASSYSNMCENTRAAIPMLRRAVAIDSTFAVAWSDLGWFQAWLVAFCRDVSVGDLKDSTIAYLNRAMRIDPQLAAPYAARSILMQLMGDWEDAEQSLRYALQLAPQDVGLYRELCLLLLRTGRTEEALRAAARAIDLDPVDTGAHQVMTQARLYSRQYDEAIEWARTWLESSRRKAVALLYLASAYSMKGQMTQAIEAAEEAAQLDPGDWSLGSLGYLYARAGERRKALEMIDRIEAHGASLRTSSYGTAVIYLGLGDHATALSVLNEQVSDRSGTWAYFLVDPVWDPVRSDPRFRSFVQQLGLAAYDSNPGGSSTG
jgi:TolB-like protein/Flp pilus assembly protein TadD/predicted Ser/Thr protein kinase